MKKSKKSLVKKTPKIIKEIQKLKPVIEELDMFLRNVSQQEYVKIREKFISKEKVGFFDTKYLARMRGIKKWDKRYPEGYNDFIRQNGEYLTTNGQQRVIDKINEIIRVLNK
jgi:predicted translin family RNA/ssDNA-binding protein